MTLRLSFGEKVKSDVRLSGSCSVSLRASRRCGDPADSVVRDSGVPRRYRGQLNHGLPLFSWDVETN